MEKTDLNQVLVQGTEAWHEWRNQNPSIKPSSSVVEMPDLSGIKGPFPSLVNANFSLVNFAGLNSSGIFRCADLSGSNLQGANFIGANLSGIDLSGTDSVGGYSEKKSRGMTFIGGVQVPVLQGVDLSGADLRGADLTGANLSRTNLSGADLRGANLSHANLVEAILDNCDLSECRVYGISAWNTQGIPKDQTGLIVTSEAEPVVTVDNIEVAQLINVIIRNERLGDVIKTLNSKVVLILGRFSPERKAILDAIRIELVKYDYCPVIFDFSVEIKRSVDEIVGMLARISRFVVADLTEPKSIPQELRGFVTEMPSLPIQPILENGQYPHSMFDFFREYRWVMETYYYNDITDVVSSIQSKIIQPPEDYLSNR